MRRKKEAVKNKSFSFCDDVNDPPSHRTKRLLQTWLACPHFFCHSFCTHRTCSTFIFSFELIVFLLVKEKNK